MCGWSWHESGPRAPRYPFVSHGIERELYGRPGREKSLYRATGLGAIAHIIIMIMVQV